MARPKQDGLLYFPFDTDFFYADKRIKRLQSKFGNEGLMLYIYLLTEIYRNGYYIGWDMDSAEDASADLNLKEGFIEQVLTYLRGRSLLEMRTLSTGVTVITSPGIQKRYQEAVKSRKRDVNVDSEIWLLNTNETATYIKVTVNESKSCGNESKSCGNESKSCGNVIKESKVKESKAKENITVSKDTVRQTDVRLVIDAWNSLCNFGIKPVSRIGGSTNRYRMLMSRIQEYGIEDVLKAIKNVEGSKFLQGNSKKGWMIDFDWFVRPNNFPKVLEGKYDDKKERIHVCSECGDKWQ